MLQDVFMLITTGDEKGSGMFVLSGPEHIINTLAPQYVLLDTTLLNVLYILMCKLGVL